MTPIYVKWLDRFQKACNTFAWTVKSMDNTRKDSLDEYIKQVAYMERTLSEIKRGKPRRRTGLTSTGLGSADGFRA